MEKQEHIGDWTLIGGFPWVFVVVSALLTFAVASSFAQIGDGMNQTRKESCIKIGGEFIVGENYLDYCKVGDEVYIQNEEKWGHIISNTL